MSRFKSLLLGASLLASLLSFAVTGAAFAEAPNADIRNGMQTPPPTDQRIALVIGNSNYQTAPKLANPGTTRNRCRNSSTRRASKSPGRPT